MRPWASLLGANTIINLTAARCRASVPATWMPTDEELMAAYVAGDEKAFDALFGRYAPMLLRIMGRQLRASEAQELVQQTFLQMHRARNDFDPTRKLRPWLMTIAYNLKRELFRRRKRKPEAPLDYEPEETEPARDPLERADDRAMVRAALATLSAGQREVIELHWFEELPFAEVAQIMGVTVSAVKVRAHRGYKAMRLALEDVTKKEEAS